MKAMNSAQRANVTDAALVELFTELDNWNCPMRQGGISVDEFLDYYAANSGGNLSNKYEILKHAAQDGYFNGVTIQDINRANGAVVVYNNATDTYTVSFCGTRGHEWNDNYIGITQESSHYQRSAAALFRYRFPRLQFRFQGGRVWPLQRRKQGPVCHHVFTESRRDRHLRCVGWTGLFGFGDGGHARARRL